MFALSLILAPEDGQKGISAYAPAGTRSQRRISQPPYAIYRNVSQNSTKLSRTMEMTATATAEYATDIEAKKRDLGCRLLL